MKPKKTIRMILEDYALSSKRIDDMLNEPLIRIKAIRKDRLDQAEQEIKGLAGEEEIEKIINKHTFVNFERQVCLDPKKDLAKALKQYWEGL